MSALLEKDDSIVPSESDSQLAKIASRELAKRGENELHVRLEDGSELALPRSATRLIQHLLTEMAHGNAVTLIPIHAELTTQEAADILGVSRPYIIKLIEKGELNFHKVGTHRRIRFRDLESFRNEFEKKRQAAMKELAAEAQSKGMGY